LASTSTPLGVALLSANSISLAYGNSTTLSSVGGFPTANWCGGCPGACEVVAGQLSMVSSQTRQTRAWDGTPDRLRQSSPPSIKGRSALRLQLTCRSLRVLGEFIAWRLRTLPAYQIGTALKIFPPLTHFPWRVLRPLTKL
jgi:hypothetical protein